jgi:hypothetical protein
MWPLAPNPPCKQMLAAVGVRCWALVLSFSSLALSLSSWPRCRCEPPYKQMLVGVGQVQLSSCLVSLSLGPLASFSVPAVSLTSRQEWEVSSPISLTHPLPPSRPCAPAPHIHPASSCPQQWWWCCWRCCWWWLALACVGSVGAHGHGGMCSVLIMPGKGGGGWSVLDGGCTRLGCVPCMYTARASWHLLASCLCGIAV